MPRRELVAGVATCSMAARFSLTLTRGFRSACLTEVLLADQLVVEVLSIYGSSLRVPAVTNHLRCHEAVRDEIRVHVASG